MGTAFKKNGLTSTNKAYCKQMEKYFDNLTNAHEKTKNISAIAVKFVHTQFIYKNQMSGGYNLAFFEHRNLKIDITRVWGRAYSSPVYDSKTPRTEKFPSNIPLYELIFFTPSDRILHYNGITKHITGNTTVFLPHCMTDVTNPPVKEYRYETFFDTGHIALQFKCDTPLATEMELYPCENFEKDIRICFEKLRNQWELKPIAYNSMALSYLYQIFAIIEKRTSPSYLPKKQYELIENSLKFIDENYLTTVIDCDYLAEMCNVSTSYYGRIFKKKFNTSPKQYILAKKLNYAMDLLATTNISITDISEMSGFSSLYYFSKIFKNYYNISPQNYRESHSDKL